MSSLANPEGNSATGVKEVCSFFQTLWPELTETGKFGISTINSKVKYRKCKTKWFDLAAEGFNVAAEYALKKSSNLHVYFHVALHNKSNGKGSNESALWVPGIWVDLDFIKPNSASDYASKEEADKALKAIGIEPTALIDTGKGYHAYWCFPEPMPAGQEALELNKRWQELIRRTINRDIDSTADLARLLRVPQTSNPKWGKLVKVVSLNPDKRYSVEDLTKLLDERGIELKEHPEDLVYTQESQETQAVREGEATFEGFSVQTLKLVQEAIEATKPWNLGVRNKQIFQFARRLCSIPEVCKARQVSKMNLYPLVEKWHKVALPFIETKDISDTWQDFVYGWKRVNYPHGEYFETAAKRAKDSQNPIPIGACSAIGLNKDSQKAVASICYELSLPNADSCFYLSCRKAAGFADCSHKTAAVILDVFCELGVLELIEAGKQGNSGKALTYKWIAPVKTNKP